MPVYIVAGQSNAVGVAYDLGVSTRGWTFRDVADGWYRIADPFDPDPVARGSWVVPLAAQMPEAGWIPAAANATRISEWAAGTPAYTRMVARGRASGRPITAVLWWQGESDRIEQTPRDEYELALADLVRRIGVDLGAPVLIATIGPDVRYDVAGSAAVRDSQASCSTRCPNARQGPDFSDVPSLADGLHFRTPAEVGIAVAKWAIAMRAANL